MEQRAEGQRATMSRLAQAVLPLAQGHAGESGIVPLTDGRDAFAARMMLADAAEQMLDVQCYIWRNDLSGTLLFDSLLRAANRRVRVRLLLDDSNAGELDIVLAALDSHPLIEVRLFNPFNRRRWRLHDYLANFGRLNRRMHNKSFTADGLATIVGGRNVGDEYFSAHQDISFVDLDVLAVGPVAGEVRADFDRYWSSAQSRPLGSVLQSSNGNTVATVAAAAAARANSPAGLAYAEALTTQPYVQQLLAGTLTPIWAPAHVLSDDPAKGRGRGGRKALLWPQIRRLFETARRELQLISPYFVPGWTGVAYFKALARRGVRISVLTNSLAATDVVAVHSGYARWRKSLLKAGIVLFEMKRAMPRATRIRRRWFSGSGSSLHAKTFVVDRTQVFVGSFNFDPRSVRLNTELGLIIDSPALAETIAGVFAEDVPRDAYRLHLSKGVLQWTEQRDEGDFAHAEEPHSGFWRRLGVTLLSLLPIERQL